MTTMIEKQINKAHKDIEKYTKAVARYTALLEKKTAKCIKLNCNWTFEQWIEHREAKTFTDDQYWAWVTASQTQDDLEEAKKHLAQAEKNLEKLTGKAEAKAEQQAEADRISGMENKWWTAMKEEMEKTPEQRKAEYEAWLKEFKAECLKDGIIIHEADANWISGIAANGKSFTMYANNGMTSRSLHCYTLQMAERGTIFTSGDFSTAYTYIKK